MHPDLLDILSRKELPISNKQLVDYLTGKLSDEECHEIEKSIAGTGVDNDAMEGLQLLGNKEKIHQYQLEINKRLRESLLQKKKHRRKRKILKLSSILMLTAGLLALILLLWLIFYFLKA